MGALGSGFNKAILPLGQEAVISRIIARFPLETRFVVATGYQGQQVRSYLEAAHPRTLIEYVEVDRFEGPGSGPGYSLSRCEELLQTPFFFISCDTLWEGDFPLDSDYNWFGTSTVSAGEAPQYCNFVLQEDPAASNQKITHIYDKSAPPPKANSQAFIGLCFIHDWSVFWPALKDKVLVEGEHQISNGIRALVNTGKAVSISLEWTDLGTAERFTAAANQFQDYDFSKTGEFLYILNGRVVKFFQNSSIVEKRVERARLNPRVFPEIATCSGQFYSYNFVKGKTLYQDCSPDILKRLLQWLKTNLWTPSGSSHEQFTLKAESFYRSKTLERLSAYHQKYPGFQEPRFINGHEVPHLDLLLTRVPWSLLFTGRPAFFHGDLQFDNILYDRETAAFVLLDWRQDFGGDVHLGDQYYDLAKLFGGILLPYDLIKKGLFSYEEEGDAVIIDFGTKFIAPEYAQILEKFVTAEGLDWHRVRLLTALIFLNMAPLHHYPFDKLLHALGRLHLHRVLDEYTRQ